jgi:addiction module HigA family antidote
MTDYFTAPIHPGTLLKSEFLEPLNMTAYGLAKALDVPRSNIEALVRGQRSLSAELALRLSRYFGNSAEFWVNAQSHYDLECAQEKIGETLKAISPRAA